MGIPGAGTYEFDADLTLEEMQAILNARGPWAWVMGDSYWQGDYLRTRPQPSLGKVGIMEQRQSPLYRGGPEEPRYLIWVSAGPARGEDSPPLAALDRLIREQILPAVGAHGVRAAVGF